MSIFVKYQKKKNQMTTFNLLGLHLYIHAIDENDAHTHTHTHTHIHTHKIKKKIQTSNLQKLYHHIHEIRRCTKTITKEKKLKMTMM